MKIVFKDWGREVWIVNNDLYCGKFLELSGGYTSSYHCHKKKYETFYCVEGGGILKYENVDIPLLPYDEPITIKPNTYHSFRSISPVKILEISTHHSDNDVFRKLPSGKISPVSKDSLEYMVSKAFDDKALDFALRNLAIDGDWAEFGVSSGTSTKKILQYLPAGVTLHLFDSFEGLPEDWKISGNRTLMDNKKGKYRVDEIPDFGDGTKLWIGMFKNTVPNFSRFNTKLSFIHIDCDLYSSTRDVLFNINNCIVPGTIICFDEFCGYDVFGGGWMDHEYRALQEFVTEFNRSFEYLGIGNAKRPSGIKSVVIKINE